MVKTKNKQTKKRLLCKQGKLPLEQQKYLVDYVCAIFLHVRDGMSLALSNNFQKLNKVDRASCHMHPSTYASSFFQYFYILDVLRGGCI